MTNKNVSSTERTKAQEVILDRTTAPVAGSSSAEVSPTNVASSSSASSATTATHTPTNNSVFASTPTSFTTDSVTNSLAPAIVEGKVTPYEQSAHKVTVKRYAIKRD